MTTKIKSTTTRPATHGEITYSDVVSLSTEEIDEKTLAVSDGVMSWIADREEYETAMTTKVRRVYTDDDDESEANYYTDFCAICRDVPQPRQDEAQAAYFAKFGHARNWSN